MIFEPSTLFAAVQGLDRLSITAVALGTVLVVFIQRYRVLYLSSLERENRYRDLIENLSVGVYRASLDGRLISANRTLVELTGHDNEQQMLHSVNESAGEYYADTCRRAEFGAILERDGHVKDFVSEIIRHKTRERIWVSETARLVLDAGTGKHLYLEGSVHEITESIRRQQQDDRFRKLTSLVPGGLFQLVRASGGTFSMPFVNAGFKNMFEIDGETGFEGFESIERVLRKADRKRLSKALEESDLKSRPLVIELRVSTTQRPERWVHVSAKPERDGDVTIWHGYISDISERKRHQLKIEDLAYFDPLTHLPNRRLLLDKLSNAITGPNRSSMFGALLFVDLDNFKVLNDTNGHDVGDQLLIKVAQRIGKSVRANDLVARIGGDEFVVMLDCIGETRELATEKTVVIAEKILNALRQVFRLGPIEHMASASIGIVVFDRTEGQIDELLKRSDVAMYEAKKNGRNGIALFDPTIMAREIKRQELLNDLHAALQGEQLLLHYQPQVDHRGRIIGAEALLRWRHPRDGIVMPDEIIRLAENSGLIGEIDRKVLASGIRALAHWQTKEHTRHLKLAINISVQSFLDPKFAAGLQSLIHEHGSDVKSLTLEMTEKVMVENMAVVGERMRQLKSLGLRLSLDDFGTGISSLSNLRQMPFDEVKIDSAFIADIGGEEKDRALLKTILELTDTLELVAVAEHVETAEQETFLRTHGCTLFQGFRYAAAMPAEQFFELVRSTTPVHSPTMADDRKRA